MTTFLPLNFDKKEIRNCIQKPNKKNINAEITHEVFRIRSRSSVAADPSAEIDFWILYILLVVLNGNDQIELWNK